MDLSAFEDQLEQFEQDATVAMHESGPVRAPQWLFAWMPRKARMRRAPVRCRRPDRTTFAPRRAQGPP
jgi:hypothetical protein